MKNVIERLSGGRQEHIDRLVEWLRIPSISTDMAMSDRPDSGFSTN